MVGSFPFPLRVALLAAALAAPITPQPVITVNLFPYIHGWLGADAAYSIPLDSTATVWLFGDTFVGRRRNVNGMIHNSIAIRKCRGGCKSTYWWSGMHTHKPDAFFRTPESSYLWPLDGFTYEGKLYVFLEQMQATSGGGAFGFDYSSIELATISNPTANPDKWLISYRTISIGNQVVPGIAAAIVEEASKNYVYMFTLFRRSAREPFVGLIRCLMDDVASPDKRAHWQYLSRDSQWLDWSRSTSPADAWKAIGGNVTEMSIKYHPESRSWFAVYPTPGFLSKTASYSTAPQLAGPWTEARPLFTYPEMENKDPRYTRSVFCYAAKEHPELETNGSLAFTYACNSLKEAEIISDMRLYRPELALNIARRIKEERDNP